MTTSPAPIRLITGRQSANAPLRWAHASCVLRWLPRHDPNVLAIGHAIYPPLGALCYYCGGGFTDTRCIRTAGL